MGYRNPVTSAGTLDTGQGFAVGSVESYTDNPTGPLGTPLHTAAGFLFRDGISGDAPASLINTAYYAAQGGNALTEQGGGIALTAGSYNAVQGPELDLNVESAAGGGYTPVARLKHAGLVIDSPGTRLQGLSLIVGAAGQVSTFGNASGQVTVTHNLGQTPTAFLIQASQNSVIPLLLDYIVWSMTTTTAVVQAVRRDTNQAFGGNPLSFHWAALVVAP